MYVSSSSGKKNRSVAFTLINAESVMYYPPPHITCMYPPPQEKVFKTTAEPICQSVMDGYNGTIFACDLFLQSLCFFTSL